MDDANGEPPLTTEQAASLCSDIITEVGSAVVASDDYLRSLLVAVLSKQHALIEDVPGTGKTLTARSIANTIGLEFNRIQFTPDMLPADITGSNIYDEDARNFRFAEGPVFSNIVLAEDINRAPPKTQSALIEAMQEKQVTVANTTRDLPEPFFVIASQNPIEEEGTFPLPTSQLDRFTVKTNMGYPERTGERDLIDRRLARRTSMPSVEQVIDPDTVTDLQEMPEFVHVDEEIREYLLDIVRGTRTHEAVATGVSPRGTQRLLEAARARAVLEGRDFAVPDDIKLLAPKVLSHRLVLDSAALVEQTSKTAVIDDVLDQVSAPLMEDL